MHSAGAYLGTAEIALGLNCGEAAEMVGKAIELIGAHFPKARADIIDWKTALQSIPACIVDKRLDDLQELSARVPVRCMPISRQYMNFAPPHHPGVKRAEIRMPQERIGFADQHASRTR